MSDEMIERLRLIIADSRDGFSTMRKDFAEELKLELEIERGIRAERNAAQQRAEQAERERDEARAVIDRVKATVQDLSIRASLSSSINAAQGVMVSVNELRVALGEMPDFEFDIPAAPQAQTGAEIAASIGDTPILPADFDIDAVDHSLDRSIAQQDTNHASLQLDYAISDMNDENNIDAVMHLIEATGHIIDVLRRMQKGGAS